MFRGLAPAIVLALLFISAGLSPAAAAGVVQKDRVIAGGPDASLEVRHLVLAGTNEQIGRALAEIAKERYGVRLEPAADQTQVRAQRKFLERNYPILLDRMRGVAAAFGQSIDDDQWDFTTLGFTDLEAGCSIAHLPPSSTANGKSVVSRDYDFTTGALSFKFLPPGKLHPTARPYLLELHPDGGYASLAMVSYDLLSGVLDGINSEGLTVALAMDNTIHHDGMEPTRNSAVGLGELQTLRLLLDTCANVEEAKRTLMATKQYYQYVPVHYLIADRNGNAFVWEYSRSHNKEYVIESPGQPLVMTNFTLHTQLEDGRPPSPEKARPVCKRYAYLREKLATGSLDDKIIRGFHQNVDAQASQAADTTSPPERTFWHAFYHPEDRLVRLSYYLRDEPYPGDERLVKPVRTDYLEFRLDPARSVAPQAKSNRSPSAVVAAPKRAAPAPAAAATPKRTATAPPAATAPISSTPATTAPSNEGAGVQSAFEAVGATVRKDGKRIVSVSLVKATRIETLLPRLQELPDLEELNLGNPAVTDAHLRALQGLPKLQSLGLMGAPVGDAGLEVLGTLSALKALNLIGTRVTDAGLAHLKDLKALEYLGLKSTAITDGGLAYLKDLAALENLNLADTRVSDAGLVHLAGLKHLESVNLSNTNVTDAGLAHLARVPGLAGINLSGTRVTDAGLVQLKPLPKLTKLNLTGTPVTDQGAKDAKKFLPFWATVTR